MCMHMAYSARKQKESFILARQDVYKRQPYEITRIHCRIFTIEELCYYLCNNLYLIDYTIMNGQLCDWLDEELEICLLYTSRCV